jgi:hypothetical protein
MLGKLRDRLVDDIHCAWRWWTTWLNAFGTVVVMYALSLDPVVHALLPFLPPSLKPYAPLLGAAWGAFVQIMRSVKQKQPGAAKA